MNGSNSSENTTQQGAVTPPEVLSSANDYVQLLKPRVMTLVVFTGLIGMLLAPTHSHPILMMTAILCISIGSGAAGAINMWYDRDIDQIMQRTKKRPLPMGLIEPANALGFGVTLAVASVLLMGLALNWVAAGLLACAIAFYVFIYTIWLKRRTPQNIVIGGAAGAFPPMIGWAAMTGDISWLPIVLFAIIFMWTPPHFWALSLYRNTDYQTAGIPMLPVTHGLRYTQWHILYYSILLLPLTLLPYFMGFFSLFYFIIALGLGILFIAGAIRILLSPTESNAKRMFGFSILYLFLLFAAMLF